MVRDKMSPNCPLIRLLTWRHSHVHPDLYTMSEGARANVSWSHDKLMDGVSTYTPEIDGHVTRALCMLSSIDENMVIKKTLRTYSLLIVVKDFEPCASLWWF